MDLKECLRKGFVRKTRVDMDLARSLVEMSNAKETAVREAKINEVTVSAYVSMAYDSLREVLEALCILHGYKVLSHICIGQILRKIMADFDYETFDRIRWIRNSINYYGQKVELRQGKAII